MKSKIETVAKHVDSYRNSDNSFNDWADYLTHELRELKRCVGLCEINGSNKSFLQSKAYYMGQVHFIAGQITGKYPDNEKLMDSVGKVNALLDELGYKPKNPVLEQILGTIEKRQLEFIRSDATKKLKDDALSEILRTPLEVRGTLTKVLYSNGSVDDAVSTLKCLGLEFDDFNKTLTKNDKELIQAGIKSLTGTQSDKKLSEKQKPVEIKRPIEKTKPIEITEKKPEPGLVEQFSNWVKKSFESESETPSVPDFKNRLKDISRSKSGPDSNEPEETKQPKKN